MPLGYPSKGYRTVFARRLRSKMRRKKLADCEKGKCFLVQKRLSPEGHHMTTIYAIVMCYYWNSSDPKPNFCEVEETFTSAEACEELAAKRQAELGA